MTDLTNSMEDSLTRLARAYDNLREQMAKVIVGQHEVTEHLLIALFSRGHVLLEGVPVSPKR